MNCERKSADKLSKLGISNYVPIQEEIHQWSDRKKKIARVVIPMIVFVHVDEAEMNLIRDLSFIFKLITYPGQSQPAIIPDNQISQLRFMVDNSTDEIIIKDQTLVNYMSFSTYRIFFPHEKGTVAIDKCEYLGITDYELEYSAPSYDLGKKNFIELVKSLKIAYKKGDVKIKRAYTALKNL
jgi:hypothetical protein